MVRLRRAMIWFWLGFFAFVALLLVLDLGVLHRKQVEPTLKSSIGWTIAWVCLGLSFSGVVYGMYEYNWLGASLSGLPDCKSGGDAAVTYVSAYLLEQALSVDNIFVIGLLFHSFRVPVKYQHRVLFWGIIGAIGFRVTMLGGGAYLAARFDWIFYVFGGYLLYQGVQLVREDEEEQSENVERSLAVRTLRRFIRIVDGDHGGKFSVIVDGRRAVTTVAVCLVVIELTDIVFALDSIPAVLSVSRETFVMITSNIFAIMGLRSLYFVLAAAMAKFKYLKFAIAVLLMLIGAKMLAHDYYEMSHLLTLLLIAGILAAGVIASVIASRGEASEEPAP
jgi:TerC family integral membrane protein